MKERLAALLSHWRRDFGFRTLASAEFSLAATALFALYNGYMGLRNRAVWNGSICVYYLLLTATRGYILCAERRRAALPPKQRRRAGRRAFTLSSAALLALNLALVIPISLMVGLRRPVGIGLIHAIATAVYATWKIVMAVVNFRRRRGSRDMLVRQLRTIGLIDALVSVLTLQNTLIMVNTDGDPGAVLTLAALSSAAVFLVILALSAGSLVVSRRRG